MLQDALIAVKTFHKMAQLAPRQDMPTNSIIEDFTPLAESLNVAFKLSEAYEDYAELIDDPRYLRAHLLMEETVETITAMMEGNQANTLDGLCDLIYVALGTAAQFGWDISEAFERVHKSNMTKQPSGIRCRDKGTSYIPVNLEDLVQ